LARASKGFSSTVAAATPSAAINYPVLLVAVIP
jgi:hypothetical protein